MPGQLPTIPQHERQGHTLALALADDGGFRIRDRLLLLKRQRWLIAATMLVFLGATWILMDLLTPRYSATTSLLVELPRPTVAGLDPTAAAGLLPELEASLPEVAIIRSRTLAGRAVAQLHLDTIDEFQPAGILPAWAVDGLARLRRAVGLPPPAERPGINPQERRRNEVIDAVLDRLKAAPVGRSRVIEVTFTSIDPERAALVANTFAELYMRDKVENKVETSERTSRWLREWLETLRLKTEDAEKAAATFREKHDLVQGERALLSAQEISQLSTDLTRARGQRAETEARLRLAERALASGGEARSAEELASPLIQTLAGQLVELRRREARLRDAYGERHPGVASARAEIAEQQGRIREEVGKIVASLRNEMSIARAREDGLARDLDALKTRAGDMGQAEARMRSLTAEAESSRQLFNNLQSRINEIAIQRDAPQANVRVLSSAPVPDLPSFPNRKVFLVLAGFVSAVLGVALALVVEQFEPGFRSAEELTRVTGLPTLSLVPLQRRRKDIRRLPDAVLTAPLSPFSDAIAASASALARQSRRLSGRGEQGQGLAHTILVTSTHSQEGKSTIAVNLARMLAQMGRRTLLVDGDLRAPTAHGLLGVVRSPGLSEVLTGAAPLSDCIRHDGPTALDILPAGEAVPNPMLMLAGSQMRTLLASLATGYDIIIVDGPPVMAVSDARIMAGLVDSTLFVVRWCRTGRRQVLASLKQLADHGATISGLMISMVDIRRHAQYGHADSGQYATDRKYYQGV
jgi:exopolysaccharide transport family protein